MKRIIYILLIVFTAGYMSSCKDMDDIYKEFIVPNGLKYPQKPDSLKAYAGYNKLRLTWMKAMDPSIVYAEIYWNNYYDTLRVDIPQDKDLIIVDVLNLKEDTYTYYVKTFDKDGNASIPSEVTGTPYGENYVKGATDRSIISALRDDNKNGTITWNAKTTDLVYSEIRYTTSSDQTKIIRVSPDDKTLICPDIKPGKLFDYRSVFLPANGVDSVAREWVTSDKPFIYKYPRTDWTAVAKNGNHPWGDGGGGQPALLFDGNTATGWHSTVGTPFPQCVVVDMKKSLMVDYINIQLPGPTNWRYIKDVQIYLTDTPIDPNAANLTTILSSMTPAAEARHEGGEVLRLNLQKSLSGRYMTLVFPNYSAGGGYISFMELEVFGY